MPASTATNNDLITRALNPIGVAQEGVTPSATVLSDGLNILNAMMASLALTEFKALGWSPQNAGTDTAPIPDWAEEMVVSALALKLASWHRVPITPELLSDARKSESTVLTYILNNTAKQADLSNMPLGRRGFIYDINQDT